jgi:CHAD domain-containing protein
MTALAFKKIKAKLEINTDASTISTTCYLIVTFLKLAQQNEQGVKEDNDIEFLHNYRVNLRKVRSILSLFKKVFDKNEQTRLKIDFSDIMKQTNRLRDLDVYLDDKQEFFQLLPEKLHPGLQQMFDAFAIERTEQFQQVAIMLDDESYAQKFNSIYNQFNSIESIQPGSKAQINTLTFARKLIWKYYNKICRIIEKTDINSSDAEIHQLRIQCKKLRYLMEFFSQLFPHKILKDIIKSMKQLQEHLGRFNDFSVQQDSLQGFINSYSSQHQNENLIAMAESIGALIILLQQKQSHERLKIMHSFSHFSSPKIRQEFSEAFHYEKVS